MYYALHDGVTVVVDEGQGSRLVGDGQRELVVVDQADFLDLGGVVDVVEEAGDAQDLGLLGAGDLDGAGADLDVDLRVLVRKFERVVEHLQVFVEGEGRARKFLLIWRDVVVKSGNQNKSSKLEIERRQSLKLRTKRDE